MGVLYKDEFQNLLINDPLGILIHCQPFGVFILITFAFGLRILDLVVDVLKIIETSHSSFKEWTSEILLSNFQLV